MCITIWKQYLSDYNVSDCSNCIVKVIKTKEDKINDIKAKNKDKSLRRSPGDYSPIFMSPEVTNCFSIITLMIIPENKSNDRFPTPKHKKIWLPF